MMKRQPMSAAILETDTVYAGFYQLHRVTVKHDLFAGGTTGPIVREVLHRSDVAAAILYDPATDCVVLVEQYRPGAHLAGVAPWLIDIVAGRIEPGHTPIDTIEREIREETGLTPLAIEPIGTFLTAPHLSSEQVHLFGATVDAAAVAGLHGMAGDHEDIRPVVLSRADAMTLMREHPLSIWAGVALRWLDQERAIRR